MSDQPLQTAIDGGTPDDSEYDMAEEITKQAILTCDPDGKGIN